MAACILPIFRSLFGPADADGELDRTTTVIVHEGAPERTSSYIEQLPLMSSFHKIPAYTGIKIMDVLEPVEEQPEEAAGRRLRVSFKAVQELARSPSSPGKEALEGGFADRRAPSPAPAPAPEAGPERPALSPRAPPARAPAPPARRPSHPVLPLDALPETLYVSRLPGAHKYHVRAGCGLLTHKMRRAELNLRVHHPCPRCFAAEIAALPTALVPLPAPAPAPAPALAPALAIEGPQENTVQAA